MKNKELAEKIKAILGPNSKQKNHIGRKNPRSVQRYMWTIQDELLAIQLYQENATIELIKEKIKDTPIKLESMKMKLSNIKFLDTGEGLENCSQSLKTLWEKHKKRR